MLVLINLDSAVERRRRMTRQLHAEGLQFAHVGIDLRGLDQARVTRAMGERFPGLQFDTRKLSGAEVGCWASHLTAWQCLAEGLVGGLADGAYDPTADRGGCSNANHANDGVINRANNDANNDANNGTNTNHHIETLAVIEDDLLLAPQFAAAVTALQASRPAVLPLDLIYLGTSSRNISQRRWLACGDLRLHAPVGVIFNTWGYVVRRDWVRRFFRSGGLIDLPIDHFIGGRARWCRPRIGVLQPAVVMEDAELGRASQIAPHTPRLDRTAIVDTLRRAVLASTVSDVYYRTVYKLL